MTGALWRPNRSGSLLTTRSPTAFDCRVLGALSVLDLGIEVAS